MDIITIICGIIILIAYLNWFKKNRKAVEERKRDLLNIDNSKEVAQAHGYILEQIGETFSGSSPMVDLKKEINSELETISKPCEVTLSISHSGCQVFCDGPTLKHTVDILRIPLAGEDLKRIEENVADGTHFLDRNEYGHKIRSEIS